MKNILLVGRDINAEAGLHRLLSMAGYKVITETDRNSMLFLLATGTPIDLVIMDDHAAEKNCNKFLWSAKQVAPNVPVVVMTSRVSVVEYLQALSLGAYEYVHKTVADHEIMRIVQAATGASKNGHMSAAAV